MASRKAKGVQNVFIAKIGRKLGRAKLVSCLWKGWGVQDSLLRKLGSESQRWAYSPRTLKNHLIFKGMQV